MKSRRKTILANKIITYDIETSKIMFRNCLRDEVFYESFLETANEFCEKENLKKSFTYFGENQIVIAIDITERFRKMFSKEGGKLVKEELTCYCVLAGGLLMFITPNGIVRTLSEFLDIFGYDKVLTIEVVKAIDLLSKESKRNRKKIFNLPKAHDTDWLLSKPKSVYELVRLTDSIEKFIDENDKGELDIGLFISKLNFKEERFQIWKVANEEYIAKMLSTNDEYSLKIGSQSS